MGVTLLFARWQRLLNLSREPKNFGRKICLGVEKVIGVHNSSSGRPIRSMGHGHEHPPAKYDIPDYRQWKIEGTPLQDVQEKLARRGLKDPWLRNEAWRYHGEFGKPYTFMGAIFKGFKWGFAAFLVSLAVEYTFFPPKKDEGHH